MCMLFGTYTEEQCVVSFRMMCSLVCVYGDFETDTENSDFQILKIEKISKLVLGPIYIYRVGQKKTATLEKPYYLPIYWTKYFRTFYSAQGVILTYVCKSIHFFVEKF